LLHMGAREVDGLRVLDFISYVLWIERWIEVNEEANRKAEAASNAT
jgi:hypothetical protein